jgi:adenine phosphoribosyltransferase
MHYLEGYIKKVENFPQEGILFYDISPLMREKMTQTIDAMSDLIDEQTWDSIDTIIGVESRGFLFASALAYKHGKGMGFVRKKGKLPNVAARKSYGLEYGTGVLEMQAGSGNVLLVDDVLATGGTLAAAADLCKETGHNVIDIACLINLKDLNNFNWNGIGCKAVFQY